MTRTRQCTVTTFPSPGSTVFLLIFHYLASPPLFMQYSCFSSYFFKILIWFKSLLFWSSNKSRDRPRNTWGIRGLWHHTSNKPILVRKRKKKKFQTSHDAGAIESIFWPFFLKPAIFGTVNATKPLTVIHPVEEDSQWQDDCFIFPLLYEGGHIGGDSDRTLDNPHKFWFQNLNFPKPVFLSVQEFQNLGIFVRNDPAFRQVGPICSNQIWTADFMEIHNSHNSSNFRLGRLAISVHAPDLHVRY